jgi:tRNA dimethylallyltransferase
MGETTRIVAIVGPTASGKARLAFEAAREAGAEILSCDSMKVYRQLDVGTAKPGPHVLRELRWHAIDVVDPHESFDASAWVRLAESVLASARARGTPVLIAGGTVLYLKALTEGLFDGPPRDPDVRARIRADASVLGAHALHERLRAVDPTAAARIHPNDLRRIERALEVHEVTGRPISELQRQFGTLRPGFERVVFSVERRRSDLDARIDRRVERMMAEGWLEEVRRLVRLERGMSKEAEQAIGYRELLAFVRGGEKGSIAETVATIQTGTRRFARRQLNWLRHHVAGVRPLEVPPGGEPVELYRDVLVKALRESVG